MNKTRKNSKQIICLLIIIFTLAGAAAAHDGWIQSNVMRVLQGDMVYIDMQFGNHENMHRDYKIYPSKWDVTKSTFWVHNPKGEIFDINSTIIDVGKDTLQTFCSGATTYTDKNGYLVATFTAEEKGIYIVDVRQDTVVSYAPERSIKCSKAIVGSVPSTMANYGSSLAGFDVNCGQVLEIVPLNDPTKLSVGDTLSFQILYKGQPLEDGEVSVIPRGKTLPVMGVPNPYDLMTDMDGMASFTFDEANYYLIVVHIETDEGGILNGKTYKMTKYTGTLNTIVRPRQLKH